MAPPNGSRGPIQRLADLPSRLIAFGRSLWRGALRRDQVEAEMRKEMAHHIELRTEALMRDGMSREDASRAAHLEFGHAESHRDAARRSRGLAFLDQLRFSWLDVKLGFRMLGKHPGLTLAAVFALAVGIPLGMGPLYFYGIVTRPLPEDDANRIRAIHYWNAERNAGEWPSQYELGRWREELTSFSAIGAVRPQRYSLAEDDGTAPPIAGAEATASTFDILGTPPLMGRALRPEDEQAGAPPVTVVGYDLWQTRLGADPDVIGSQIRVRETSHTVVGVMPEGFLFPRAHQLWIPLRRTLLSEPDEGPSVQMFGRLTDGVDSEEYLRTTITLPVGDEPLPGIDSFDAERDSPGPDFARRVAETQRAVVERLEAEPWVRGVAVASELPRTGHESARVEIEGESAFEELGFFDTLDRWPAVVRADLGFFDGLGQPILAGRGFNEADLDGEPTTAIVNTRFVDRTLGGRNVLGRRIRFPDRNPEGEPRWLEIVGVVDRLGTNVGLPEYDAAVYLPAAPGELYPLRLAIHVAGGDPAAFAPRVRELVTEVEPAAVVVPPIPLSEVFPGNYLMFVVTSSGVTLFVLILVAMAISGIYAILSFAVSERTREIAIRTALGAGKASIVGKVAQRTLWQIGLGAVLGMPLAGWLFQMAESGTDSGSASFGVALGAGIGIVVLIGFVSGFVPTRRALKIQPTEALRGVE